MVLRVLFVIVAFYNLDINQMDIKTTFFYGLIDQLIYVELLKGMETKVNKNMVYILLKALYNLKQSPRLWYERLSTFFLERLSLKQTHTDYSIFTIDADLDRPIVSMFIENIKIMGPNGSRVIQKVKDELIAVFSMVDMSFISFYLDLKVERDWEKRTMKLSQPAYIDKVLKKYHLDNTNAVNIPMKETVPLMPKTDGKASPSKRETY